MDVYLHYWHAVRTFLYNLKREPTAPFWCPLKSHNGDEADLSSQHAFYLFIILFLLVFGHVNIFLSLPSCDPLEDLSTDL